MDKPFWEQVILEAAGIDFGEPLPEVDRRFLSVWSDHYARIAAMTRPSSPILEIGTGYGVLAAGLAGKTRDRIFSLEHPSRGYFFRQAYRSFLKGKGVVLAGGDLREGLPFQSNSLRQVYFCDVIEHLEPSVVPTVLDEITRVLEVGGELICSTPNLNRFSNLVRFVSGHTVNPPLQSGCYGATHGHIREFAFKELERLFRRHGLTPTRRRFERNPYFTHEAFGEDSVFSRRTADRINALSRLVHVFLPRLGDEVYILARKG